MLSFFLHPHEKGFDHEVSIIDIAVIRDYKCLKMSFKWRKISWISKQYCKNNNTTLYPLQIANCHSKSKIKKNAIKFLRHPFLSGKSRFRKKKSHQASDQLRNICALSETLKYLVLLYFQEKRTFSPLDENIQCYL